jgi:gamma-glutamylputrescine oxidase
MRPVWDLERNNYPTAELPRSAEIVVVGGGLTGVLLALELAASGRRPLLIEQGGLANGASGRNAGLLLPGSAEPYPALIARWGRAQAQEIWAAMEWGAARLVEHLEVHDVACHWRAEGALHGAVDADEATDLIEATGLLAADGFQANWLEPDELERWLGRQNGLSELHGALHQPHGGPLHSGLLVTGLAKAAARQGAVIVQETEVTAVREDHDGVTVATSRGRVSSDACIVATNAWNARGRTYMSEAEESAAAEAGTMATLMPPSSESTPRSTLIPEIEGLVTSVRGQVLASCPMPRQIEGAWSLNRGFEYFQQLPDGRLVAGGMRWVDPAMEIGVAEHELHAEIQTRLGEWVATLGVQSEAELVEYRWSGLMAWTQDRLPLVGRVPERNNLWMALGYSGHGLPAAPLAAAILRARLNGEPPIALTNLLDPAARM